MKILIYKTNPKIRIASPEIESYREFYTLQDKDSHYLFKMDDWTLVEEAQKPVEWSEEDENNIGKLHRLLVICQSEKKFIPTSEYEKLDKWLKSLRPQPRKEWSEEQPEVDLEKEAVAFCFNNGINVTPYQATRFARHFYELGLNARKEEQL